MVGVDSVGDVLGVGSFKFVFWNLGLLRGEEDRILELYCTEEAMAYSMVELMSGGV